MGKDTRIQFRVTEQKMERFKRCSKKVKLDQTALGESAVDALCDYIEANGEITLPLAVIPESVLAKLRAGKLPPTFPSTAPRTPTGALSLNEEPPKRDAVPLIPTTPRETRTRKILRGEALKTKPQKS